MSAFEPIARRVTVRAPIERAFRVFTEEMGAWWPLQTHSVSVDQELGQEAVGVTMGAGVGGRIEEVLADGSTRDWGQVVEWVPPHRVVLAWKPNERPTPPTEVDVRFSSDGDATVVDVEHRGWDRLGSVAAEIHPLYASETGWTMVLGLYRDVAEGDPAR